MAKITISPDIKRDIAIAHLAEYSDGYDRALQGVHYLVNGELVVCVQENRLWDPWPDNAEVVDIGILIMEIGGAQAEGADFTGPALEGDALEEAIEFTLGYIPDEYDAGDLSEN